MNSTVSTFCRRFFDIFNPPPISRSLRRVIPRRQAWKKKSILIQGRWRMEEWLGGNDHGEWSITYDLHAEINRANRGWGMIAGAREVDAGPNGSVGIREWFWFPRHFHARSFPSLAAYRQKMSPRLAFFFSSINRENHSIPPSVFIYP